MLVEHLQKTNKEYKNLKKQKIHDIFVKMNYIKRFQHDMAYGDFKDLTRRTASDKIFRDKAFNIAKNPNYNGYERDLVSMIYKFFDKKTASGAVEMKSCKIMS